MEKINLVIEKALGCVSRETVFGLQGKAAKGMEQLHQGTGLGNDFLGWLNLPNEISEADLTEIETAAHNLQSRCEVVVVIGIGGSYLGAKAVIEAMSNSFEHLRKQHNAPIVLFAGQNIGEDYLYELQELLADKQFGIVVISKSGTTTEPAIAFRLLKEQLEKQVGKEEAGQRIIAVTDATKGALRKLADTEGYKTFVIADNVGGRFSVLTPVGLLPIAIAGFDIRALVAGACDMQKHVARMFPSNKIPPCSTLLHATLFIKPVKRPRYLSTSTPNCTTLPSGGNNSTAKAKAKTTWAFSPLQSTLPPTCTLWANGYKKANVLSLKQYSR